MIEETWEGRSDGSGCMIISSDLDSLGVIKQNNAAIAQMLGYSHQEILDSNIDYHIPAIYRNIHSNAFHKYFLKTSTLGSYPEFSPSSIKHRKKVFLLTKSKTIILCSITLQKSFSLTGNNFICAIFNLDKTALKPNICNILLDTNYNIDSLSPSKYNIIFIGCPTFLGLFPEFLKYKVVSMLTLIPNLLQNDSVFDPRGNVFTYNKPKQEEELHAYKGNIYIYIYIYI